MIPHRQILLFLLLFAALPAICFAQPSWPTSPEEDMPIFNAEAWGFGAQSYPDGSGGVYIVWGISSSGQETVSVQHITEDGTRTFPTGGMAVCTYASEQEYFDAVPDGVGGLIVVWRDIDGEEWNIFGQRFDSEGYLWNPQGQAICTYSGMQFQPKVIADSEVLGGCFVAYTDSRDNYDIYAQRLNENGVSQWAANGVPVCTDPDYQWVPHLVSDSAGGIIVAWRDNRYSGDYRIMGQRLMGSAAPLWAANGVSLGSLVIGHDQEIYKMVSDGMGGAYISFVEEQNDSSELESNIMYVGGEGYASWTREIRPGTDLSEEANIIEDGVGGIYAAASYEVSGDQQIFIQHFSPEGYTLMGNGGQRVCENNSGQIYPSLALDGSGGFLVSWRDERIGIYSTYAQHYSGSGQQLWDPAGMIVSLEARAITGGMTATEDGGAILALHKDTDIYAKRIGPNGYLADGRPSAVAVVDFPNDQGGQVTVSWAASLFDSPDHLAITEYSVWMREPEAKSSLLDEKQSRILALEKGWSTETVGQWAKAGWGYVNVVPAMQETNYFTFGPTFADSTGASIPLIEYRIVAHTGNSWITWESTPVTGYSVDNLAPGAPLALVGNVELSGDIQLDWEASGTLDEDLSHYIIYRGDGPAFPLDAAHEIATSPTPAYLDSPSATTRYYRVAALDCHGNKSGGSNEIMVDSLTGAPNAVTAYALHANWPNPFNPRTKIAFDLPQDSRVQLAVFAVDGTRVKTLVDANRSAGHHEVFWDGCDDQRRAVAAGVYFYNIAAGEYHAGKRMVLIR